jgi:ribosomal protein S15P/S13E
LTLRDQYGIPKVRLYNIKIGSVLKENQKFSEPTHINLQKKVLNIQSHIKVHKGDKVAGRSLIVSKAKFKKQEQYLESRKV